MKEKLRKEYSAIRNNLSNDEIEIKSKLILNKLKKVVDDYETVLIYINTKSEVKTYEFIEELIKLNKKVYTPVIIQNKMSFAKINSIKQTKIGKYGIKEPISEEYYLGEKAVVIVPGLVFSKNKYRIGYGGGFYDKFINENKQNYYIGICFEEQIVEKFQNEDFDQKVNYIITDKNNY